MDPPIEPYIRDGDWEPVGGKYATGRQPEEGEMGPGGGKMAGVQRPQYEGQSGTDGLVEPPTINSVPLTAWG